MAVNAHAAALRKRREKWVDTDEGKRVQFRRPTESEMGAHLEVRGQGESATSTWVIRNDDVFKYVVGWEGYTEADILGAAVGASDPLPFDADLFREFALDNVDLLGKVAKGILDSILAYISEKAAVAKN